MKLLVQISTTEQSSIALSSEVIKLREENKILRDWVLTFSQQVQRLDNIMPLQATSPV